MVAHQRGGTLESLANGCLFSGKTKTHCDRAMVRTLFAVLSIAVGGACLAEPKIDSITGDNIADGQTVTISGSGFGAGPTVVVFDDFESGNPKDGEVIPLTSPEIGTWSSYTTDGRPRYSADARSGKHGFRISDSTFNPNSGDSRKMGSFTKLLPAPTTEVYATYAISVPPGTTFPGASTPNTLPARLSSLKGLWLSDGPDGIFGRGLSDIWFPGWAGYWQVAGNSGAILKNIGPVSPWFSFKTWNRISVWLKADPGAPVTHAGTIFVQTTNPDTGHLENNWTDRSPFAGPTAFGNPPSSGKWDRFMLPGWWGNGDNTRNQMTYDDVYVAAGPNAAARVEIGDASTYKRSRILAISTPQAWNDKEVTVTLRAGPFTGFSNAYLFVIDANNNPSKGYPLGAATPSAPTGVIVK